MATRRPFTNKVEKSVSEMQHGELHSGSKSGPTVTNPKQAIAIGLSEQRKAPGAPLRRALKTLTK